MTVQIPTLWKIQRQRKTIMAVSETREVGLSSRLEDMVVVLQGHLDVAREQNCIDPPTIEFDVADSYGDHSVKVSVGWMRPATQEEILAYEDSANAYRKQANDSAKDALRTAVRRNPDVAREVLAELDGS